MRPSDDKHRRRELAALADRQHGVVARAQVLALGFGPDQVKRMLRAHVLRPVHPGVYTVGHQALTGAGWQRAATLAAGDGAVLSHVTAAVVHDLRASASAWVHVLRRDTTPLRLRGVRVHRTVWLPEADRVLVDGLPVTSVARTVVDLAALLSPRELERLLDRADLLRVLDQRALGAALAARAGAPGLKRLGAVLAGWRPGTTLTESGAEERLLRALDRRLVPRPVAQHWVGSYRLDFAWVAERLAVEVDVHPWHRTPEGIESDGTRDRRLEQQGWRVERFGPEQLEWAADACADTVARRLAERRDRPLAA